MKPLDQVEPRTPILPSQLPITISQPGSYYLTGSVSTAGGGITINSDNVSLDLMGFTLSGGTGKGIRVTSGGRKGIVVRNGIVANWPGGGLDLAEATGALVEDVRAHNNGGVGLDVGTYGAMARVIRCTAMENLSDGILVGADSVVERSLAYDNLGTGISGGVRTIVDACTATFNHVDGITGQGVIVKDSTASENHGVGINVAYAAVVTGCTCIYNGTYGIRAQNGSRVEGNTAQQNGLSGILVFYSTLVAGNVSSDNGRLGDGAGIQVAITPGCRIEGNNVSGNDTGIFVPGTNTVVVKNTAQGNTVEYNIASGNAAGAISTSPIGAGPWDNFDF